MSTTFADIQQWFGNVFIDQFDTWIAIGLVAQILFTMRFVVQWLASEKAGRSVVPVAFWFLSIGGGTVLLLYAIERQDPVFIAGQSFGVFIYVRNLMLIRRERLVGQEA